MRASTGIPSLDTILHGVRPGDNVVWQVDTIDDYLPLVHSLSRYAVSEGEDLIYFRFAAHKELIERLAGKISHHLLKSSKYPE